MAPSTAVKCYSLFSGLKSTALYSLVDFGDEGTAILQFSRIVDGSTIDKRCRVKWSDGKEYDAALVFTGKSFITELKASLLPAYSNIISLLYSGTNKECISKRKELEKECDKQLPPGEQLNDLPDKDKEQKKKRRRKQLKVY